MTTTPETPAEGLQETPETTPETFPAEYVRELRAEAAEHRTSAKDATARLDDLTARLRTEVLKAASSGVLREPLEWSDDLADEEGLPDPEKVAEAVQALATAKPWMSRPTGDVGQGFRGEESDTVNLADVLRAGA